MIEIFAERMGNGSKMLLDGAHSSWVDGDSIRINSDKVVVERINDHAYIRYAAPLSINRAVYPASLASGNLSSDNVTLTFPAYYHYRTDGSGHQLLDLPMAARSEGDDPMQFKHLTGALYITVTNTAAVPLTLQSVTIQSNIYQLNGTRSIDLSDLDNIGSVVADLGSKRNVTLVFDTGYTLAANASVKVMIPIMPVGSDHKFTIQVKSHAEGQSKSYLKSQSQPESGDHSLTRNQLGYAPISIVASGTTTDVLAYDAGMYLIRTPLDFSLMVEAIQNQWLDNSANYKIMEDIDMEGSPITTINTTSYAGTFDGNGHIIKNLTINSLNLGQSGSFCALFKTVNSSAEICNLVFNNLTLKHQSQTNYPLYMSAIIASLENTTSGVNPLLNISNCTVNICSTIIQNANNNIYFGGLICNTNGKSAHHRFYNCHVNIPNQIIISNTSIYWGGFIGYTGTAQTAIEESSFSGNVTLTATKNVYLGGIIGRKNSSNFYVRNCSTSGTINTTANGTTKYIGSAIGYYSSPNQTDTLGITKDITFTLNNDNISPNPFGNNQ